MQIRDYWRVFSKRWWLVVLVAAVAVVASYGYTRFQTRIYRSTVRLTVSPSRLDYGLTLVIESLLHQYTQEIQTRNLAGIVDDKLQLDLPVETLLGKVHVTADTTDYVIEMTVDDTDPNRARAIAQIWADQFIQQHQERMAPIDPQDRINIKMIDNPIAGVLFYPKTKQIVIAAGVFGVVVGTLLAFFVDYLDDTLRTVEDVERFTALPVVGMVPHIVTTEGTSKNGRIEAGVLGGSH